MSIKVIFISGNIGSGKETMLWYLDESLTNRGIMIFTLGYALCLNVIC